MLKLCTYVYLCFCSKLVKYNIVVDEFTSDYCCCCYEMLLLMIEALGNHNHKACCEIVLFLRNFIRMGQMVIFVKRMFWFKFYMVLSLFWCL